MKIIKKIFALTSFNISHHKFISIKNVLKEYDEVKEKIRNPNKKYV